MNTFRDLVKLIAPSCINEGSSFIDRLKQTHTALTAAVQDTLPKGKDGTPSAFEAPFFPGTQPDASISPEESRRLVHDVQSRTPEEIATDAAATERARAERKTSNYPVPPSTISPVASPRHMSMISEPSQETKDADPSLGATGIGVSRGRPSVTPQKLGTATSKEVKNRLKAIEARRAVHTALVKGGKLDPIIWPFNKWNTLFQGSTYTREKQPVRSGRSAIHDVAGPQDRGVVLVVPSETGADPAAVVTSDSSTVPSVGIHPDQAKQQFATMAGLLAGVADTTVAPKQGKPKGKGNKGNSGKGKK